MQKLLQLISDIEKIEDFVKISVLDGKIDEETGREIIRMTRESIEHSLK